MDAKSSAHFSAYCTYCIISARVTPPPYAYSQPQSLELFQPASVGHFPSTYWSPPPPPFSPCKYRQLVCAGRAASRSGQDSGHGISRGRVKTADRGPASVPVTVLVNLGVLKSLPQREIEACSRSCEHAEGWTTDAVGCESRETSSAAATAAYASATFAPGAPLVSSCTFF